MTDFNKNMKKAFEKYKNKPSDFNKNMKEAFEKYKKQKTTKKEKSLIKKFNKLLKENKPTRGGGGGGPLSTKDLLQTPGKRKLLMAGGGKVKSKFFTGGTANPSFGTDFDDR